MGSVIVESEHGPEELVVDVIAKANDDRILARATVDEADLSLARDETWREGMRVGALGKELDRLAMKVLAGKRQDNGRLEGYEIELADRDRSFRRHFSVLSAAPIARRRIAAIANGETAATETEYHFYLTTLPLVAPPNNGNQKAPDDNPLTASSDAPPMRVSRRREPPVFEPARLLDFLAASEPLEGTSAPVEDGPNPPMPIFMTPGAWEQGHEWSRRGGDRESSGIFTGLLKQDIDSPELFLVLDCCIEAKHAEEDQFSITFTGETWEQVRRVLRQRQKRLHRPHERVLGAVHGHNFLPEADAGGRRMCDACPTAKVCGRTTAVASVADFEWFASVFAGQPWSLSLIHGYNARGDEDWRLYHLSDGALVPRSIRLLRESTSQVIHRR